MENWYKIAQKQVIVSFDFDDTIYSLDRNPEDGELVYAPDDEFYSTPLGRVNDGIVSLIKKYHSNNYKVICVTSRRSVYKSEVEEIIRENNLPIYEIYCTEGRDKVHMLLELGVSIHYDDDHYELEALKGTNIQGIQVNCENM